MNDMQKYLAARKPYSKSIVSRPQRLHHVIQPNQQQSISVFTDPELIDQLRDILALKGGGRFERQVGVQLKKGAANTVSDLTWLAAKAVAGLMVVFFILLGVLLFMATLSFLTPH
jgi:hypothetical protein